MIFIFLMYKSHHRLTSIVGRINNHVCAVYDLRFESFAVFKIHVKDFKKEKNK